MALATLVVYLVVGLVLAAILAVREGRPTAASPGVFLLRAALWPVFVPLLAPEAPPPAAGDEARIQAAEAKLSEALRALGGLLGDGLSLEMRRVEALGRAMRTATARKRELDGLLSSPEHDLARLTAELERLQGSPVAEILAQRLEHVRRLTALRAQTDAELERALARAGELATRLTLLRYDNGSVPGAAATAQQLASSIDELCAVLGELKVA